MTTISKTISSWNIRQRCSTPWFPWTVPSYMRLLSPWILGPLPMTGLVWMRMSWMSRFQNIGLCGGLQVKEPPLASGIRCSPHLQSSSCIQVKRHNLSWYYICLFWNLDIKCWTLKLYHTSITSKNSEDFTLSWPKYFLCHQPPVTIRSRSCYRTSWPVPSLLKNLSFWISYLSYGLGVPHAPSTVHSLPCGFRNSTRLVVFWKHIDHRHLETIDPINAQAIPHPKALYIPFWRHTLHGLHSFSFTLFEDDTRTPLKQKIVLKNLSWRAYDAMGADLSFAASMQPSSAFF